MPLMGFLEKMIFRLCVLLGLLALVTSKKGTSKAIKNPPIPYEQTLHLTHWQYCEGCKKTTEFIDSEISKAKNEITMDHKKTGNLGTASLYIPDVIQGLCDRPELNRYEAHIRVSCFKIFQEYNKFYDLFEGESNSVSKTSPKTFFDIKQQVCVDRLEACPALEFNRSSIPVNQRSECSSCFLLMHTLHTALLNDHPSISPVTPTSAYLPLPLSKKTLSSKLDEVCESLPYEFQPHGWLQDPCDRLREEKLSLLTELLSTYLSNHREKTKQNIQLKEIQDSIQKNLQQQEELQERLKNIQEEMEDEKRMLKRRWIAIKKEEKEKQKLLRKQQQQKQLQIEEGEEESVREKEMMEYEESEEEEEEYEEEEEEEGEEEEEPIPSDLNYLLTKEELEKQKERLNLQSTFISMSNELRPNLIHLESQEKEWNYDRKIEQEKSIRTKERVLKKYQHAGDLSLGYTTMEQIQEERNQSLFTPSFPIPEEELMKLRKEILIHEEKEEEEWEILNTPLPIWTCQKLFPKNCHENEKGFYYSSSSSSSSSTPTTTTTTTTNHNNNNQHAVRGAGGWGWLKNWEDEQERKKQEILIEIQQIQMLKEKGEWIDEKYEDEDEDERKEREEEEFKKKEKDLQKEKDFKKKLKQQEKRRIQGMKKDEQKKLNKKNQNKRGKKIKNIRKPQSSSLKKDEF